MILIPPAPIMTPYYLQNVTDMKEVITTNDATVQGILIALCLIFAGAIIYLYKEKNSIQKEYVEFIKEHAEVTKDYADRLRELYDANREFLTMIEKMTK